MRILAIDPGPTESAFVLYEAGLILLKGKQPNEDVLRVCQDSSADHCVIERIASYGMAVGAEVFETCVWTGRFLQAWDDSMHGPSSRLTRKEVVVHLCGSARAKDCNVRQALIDQFGQPGTKKAPGMLYGVSKDVWSALAVAVVFDERSRLTAGAVR